MSNEIELSDLNAIDIQLQEESLALAKKKVKWNGMRPTFAPVINALMKAGVEPSMDNWNLNVSFSGDAKKFAVVMRILRTSGFNTSSDRPKQGDTTWSAYFVHPSSTVHLWMYFTSSVCKRVQVGTETKEVPVYETKCGEDISCETEAISGTESTPALMAPMSS